MKDTPASRLEVLEGWGMACHARSRVYRPRSADEAAHALADARTRGLTVVHRGSGLSYGDAALNQGGATIVCTGLDRILAFDPDVGRVRAEAGVTMRRLWQTVLPTGWWPPVVPGTMEVTLGGAVAMNIHGKNQFVAGSIGEHVEGLTVLRADGAVEALTAAADGDALREVVGAQGLNGTILDVTLRLKRVHAGRLDVLSVSTGGLEETLERIEADVAGADYTVAWIDTTSRRRPGRGIVHFAWHLAADHRLAGEGLSVDAQELPGRLLGVLPRDQAWRALRPFTNDPGMTAVNAGRYWAGRVRDGHRYTQPHAAFHFLLDYVPGWKRVYAPHGLIQYQLFAPAESAEEVFREALACQRRQGVLSYLGVVKRHRPDAFAGSYSLDGFSLALDVPVRLGRLDALGRLVRSYDALLADAGGRIYAAKDAWSVGRLPRRRDPAFSSNLVRRWERGRLGPAGA